MPYEQRELSGTLFKNQKKEQPKHPDYTGECMIGGTKYRMSAWIKEGTKGKWMSVAFTPANEKGHATKASMADDSVPF